MAMGGDSISRQVSIDEDDRFRHWGATSTDPATMHPSLSSYWQSEEARKLFPPMEFEDSPEEAIENMMALLELATTDRGVGSASLEIVDGHDRYGLLSNVERTKLYVKGAYILAALKKAKENIRTVARHFSFHDTCEQVLQGDSIVGTEAYHPIQAATVGRWYRDFRKNRVFENPKRELLQSLLPLLQFFRQNPHLEDSFLFHLKEAAADQKLCPNYAHSYFFRVTLPSSQYALSGNGYYWMGNDWWKHIHSGTFRDWLRLRGFDDVYSERTGRSLWKLREETNPQQTAQNPHSYPNAKAQLKVVLGGGSRYKRCN